ncbi:polymer-forming cytoskeletal protein [Acidovorax sp. SUPP1855]|uniref:bactofilin family protein n=1 Tax=unclassified Acidovorax TaxID=2684926 RepID=UPI0023DE5C80|nr:MULTISPECIES: polymer-forming cytoskeletal protein [unclassified Acidovorax]GKS84081.1 polymer-forming cytoskeletal protein [Acidovorax sp. SUPP1855]GKS91964.1 polymer-forming cytoskeletal protein [Acidovorax sp. SUPP2539]
MAVQNPFFGKREPDAFQPRQPSSVLGGATTVVPGGNSATTTTPSSAKPVSTGTAPGSAVSDGVGSKLTVGPNIKLKGVEITDCDTLVVEGTVEATMDSRVIHIAEQGAFRGSAEIDIAEIHGEFDGTLTVREKLVIYSTGKVTGKIRYGKVVIEEGGQLAGEIFAGTSGPAPRANAVSNNNTTNARNEAPALAAA